MNFLSGHMLVLRVYLKEILGKCVYAKIYHTCTNVEKKKKDPWVHRCPKKYVGSSKATEAEAALQLVKELWQVSKVWVKRVVSDDDSYIRSILCHSYREVWNSGVHDIKEEEKYTRIRIWPKTPSNKLVTDNWKLLLEMDTIAEYLCDLAHRKKCFGSHLYKAMKAKTDLGKFNYDKWCDTL